ncbi:MAG: hypothetical protein ONB46_22930, partial [candidate division KSB1 bacterium]|nr:hypothetical protein [candidate division KSB1 bacterium]MDZ7406497.1 hypothetical protein [candidate division KSB1 bacterium]
MEKFIKILLLLSLSFGNDSYSRQNANVLIVYYSVEGHTKALAEAVAEGARSVSGALTHKYCYRNHLEIESLPHNMCYHTLEPYYEQKISSRILTS